MSHLQTIFELINSDSAAEMFYFFASFGIGCGFLITFLLDLLAYGIFKALSLVNIHDLFADADSGAESVVSSLSSAFSDAAGLLKGKFPFSLPRDIYFIMGFFKEEPRAPVFRLPIRIGSAGINEVIEIDMGDFEILSRLSRSILSLLFILGFMKLTPLLLDIGKDN